MGVNIMSTSFAHDLLRDMPLTPTTKYLKSLLGYILPSLGILYVLPIKVKGTMVHLSFYIFDIMEFDLLIGQPIERLIQEGQTGSLKVSLCWYFLTSLQSIGFQSILSNGARNTLLVLLSNITNV